MKVYLHPYVRVFDGVTNSQMKSLRLWYYGAEINSLENIDSSYLEEIVCFTKNVVPVKNDVVALTDAWDCAGPTVVPQYAWDAWQANPQSGKESIPPRNRIVHHCITPMNDANPLLYLVSARKA